MDSQHYDNKEVARTRKAAGLTQDQLAEELGVTNVTISRVETGEAASYEILSRIAVRFGRSVKEFLYDQPLQQSGKNFSATT